MENQQPVEKQPLENQEPLRENIQRVKKRKIFREEDNLLKLACDRLADNTNEGAVLSKCWASQYSELAQRQKLFVRKIFSDTLFQAGLERLTENTVRSIQNILDPPERTSTPLWSESSLSSFSYQPIIQTQTITQPQPIIQSQTIAQPQPPTIINAKDFFHNFNDI